MRSFAQRYADSDKAPRQTQRNSRFITTFLEPPAERSAARIGWSIHDSCRSVHRLLARI